MSSESLGVADNLKADIKASLQGLAGSFDASINETTQYKQFVAATTVKAALQGGDTHLADIIFNTPTDPAVNDTYTEWLATAAEHPAVFSFGTMTLWELMNDPRVPEAQGVWEDVQNAFLWLANHPEQHTTPCTLTINSDWAEIGILVPAAHIIIDPTTQADTRVHISPTKLKFRAPGPVTNHAIK